MASLCPKCQKSSVRITAVKAMGRTDLASHSLCIQELLVPSFFFPFLNHPLGSTRAAYYFRDILLCLLLVDQFLDTNCLLCCAQGAQISMGRVALLGIIQQEHPCKDQWIDTTYVCNAGRFISMLGFTLWTNTKHWHKIEQDINTFNLNSIHSSTPQGNSP